MSPRPVPPIAPVHLSAHGLASAAGLGMPALADALAQDRSALAANDFSCVAWLGLQADGFAMAVEEARLTTCWGVRA